MPDSVKASIQTAETLGTSQFKAFVSERLDDLSTPFFDSIPKNNLPLFNTATEKKGSKLSTKVSDLNSDVNLFSKLYIASQSREVDMDNFFAHENHPWPPSLATNGRMNATCKSDLIECLETVVSFSDTEPVVDACIVAGAALIHCLDPKKSTDRVCTFQYYATNVFIPAIHKKYWKLFVALTLSGTDTLKAA